MEPGSGNTRLVLCPSHGIQWSGENGNSGAKVEKNIPRAQILRDGGHVKEVPRCLGTRDPAD